MSKNRLRKLYPEYHTYSPLTMYYSYISHLFVGSSESFHFSCRAGDSFASACFVYYKKWTRWKSRIPDAASGVERLHAFSLTYRGPKYILVGMKQAKDPEKTRKKLLESALHEIHLKGFNAASLNDILADTGLTRGALYHHFPNKRALGYASLDYIKEMVIEMWMRPFENCDDPITRIREILTTIDDTFQEEDIVLGCPLNNLAQEMSPLDEGFRERVVEIYEVWRTSIAGALRRGQTAGTVNREIDAYDIATFFVAALTGGRGLAKTTQSREVLRVCIENLLRCLETLRARP